jgi:predicted Fe-Mo cluster-binding NifX family protein
MKIAIPTMDPRGMDSEISEHFGRAPFYVLVDPDSGQVDVVPNTSDHMGGTGDPTDLLKNHGIEVLLCRGLGRHAVSAFTQDGIAIYIGANGTVQHALGLWRNGALTKATLQNACCQHAAGCHGDQGH